VAGCCKYGYEPSGYCATDLVDRLFYNCKIKLKTSYLRGLKRHAFLYPVFCKLSPEFNCQFKSLSLLLLTITFFHNLMQRGLSDTPRATSGSTPRLTRTTKLFVNLLLITKSSYIL
jgi:hypothetical protein